jgi:signal transduction histidine kinase
VLSTIHRVLSARRGLSIFLAGVVCLAAWQVWLTWRLLEQDQNLELQRSRERLGQIADLVVLQLAASLGDWDIGLHELNSLPPSPSLQGRLPAGSIFLFISRGTVSVYPRRPLLFTPAPPVQQGPPPEAFDASDALELRDQQYERAIAALEPLTRGTATRPEALLRIARIEHKSNRKEAALTTYGLLATENALNSSGTPYALLASVARCRIWKELGKAHEASREANSLRDSLLEGRWPLRRDAFEYYWSQLNLFAISAGQPPRSSIDFSVLVSHLYDRWQSSQSKEPEASGRMLQSDSSLLVWNSTPDHLTALVTPPGWLSSNMKLLVNTSDVRWRLLGTGTSATKGLTVTRSLAEAQLTGRLEFISVQPISGTAASRRSLWLAGVAMMLIVVLGSGYVLQRAIGRELQVARLQSDFVAAVSHEFRSPLTTLRTISELLAQDRIPDETRRRQNYAFLDHETNRLHRLVEDLLDFGRMESGRRPYRMETYDVFQLVRAALADVGEYVAAKGFHVESNLGSIPATIRADEEALRRAVRNLIENAIKYSPECRTVWVEGAVANGCVSISVRDRGMGIDAAERRSIFQKFVRGDAAKNSGIKGTGIGLAMVQQISEAMGGEIRLQSEVGAGSTFTIVLPLADD